MTNQQAVTKAFEASPQQADYFMWLTNGSGSCILEARAGTGKTTTIIHGLPLMSGNIFVGAYNTKIANEIKEKVTKLNLPNVRVGTMHSIGFYTWRRHAGNNVKVDENKCRDIFREMFVEGTDERTFEAAVLKLVSLAKQAAMGVAGGTPSKRSAWMGLIDHFDIDTLEKDELVIQMAAKVLGQSCKTDTKVIDYDDMLFAPLFHNCRAFQNEWVVIDEAQDTNAARRLLALKILKPNGRLVAVGDPHQAIYGFTGADADALNLIGASKNAKTLPLTVTYRCPKAVVSYAQQWVKDIEAHPSAPEGVVRSEDDNFKLVDSVKPYDAILCRFNAPLVENVYQFIAKGIPAKIEGREIGEGLKTLARRWKVRNFDQLLERLGKYEAKEVAKFQKKEQPTRVQGVQDKCQCLRTLITRTIEVGYTGDCVAALCAQIESIFADNVNGGHVVLTSIHKSKGREWNKVFWLQTGASTLAKQEWEQVQENNLCYVAATRAKAELILVPAPKKVK